MLLQSGLTKLSKPRTRRTTPATIHAPGNEVELRRTPTALIAGAEHRAFVAILLLAVNPRAAPRQNLSVIRHACRPTFAANAAKGMWCPPAGSQMTSVSRARVIIT